MSGFIGIRLIGLTMLVSLALGLSGCGAAMSTYLILAASSELDGAEAAEAPKYAPYEYTAAEQYLQKAREEQGYADFGAAIEYAFKAQELAEKGRERAEKVKRDQQPPPGAPTAPLPSDAAEAPASNVIIRQRPEQPSASEPAAPNNAPIIVPVQPSPEAPTPSPAPSGESDDEQAPPIRIIPIRPPADDAATTDPGTAPPQ